MHNKKNPCGLDGFAFVEFSGHDPAFFNNLFTSMGFYASHQHISGTITLYQQGNIHFIVNHTPASQARTHFETHGDGACAMGFRVANAQQAFAYALQRGATAFTPANPSHPHLPAIQAIGGSVIYFVDDNNPLINKDWQPILSTHIPPHAHLLDIDHLTHNVHRGNMDAWAAYYENIFHFEEIRHFDIQGQATGLVSRAMGSPCGKIKIPLNESKDDQSQIEEFLHAYRGEGIQHIALSSSDIYASITNMRQHQVRFLDVPNTYYEMIGDRIPWHHEPVQALQKDRILIDGGSTPDKGLLLQIFTENVFGPVFFEIIQRKGNESFGEGNFQALFEAIERDQIRRGTLTV